MGHEVRHVPERARYEIWVDGTPAGVADYYVVGDQVVFPHTEIDPRRRGQALGAELVRGALDDVRRTGRTVVAHCWYVRRFIDENPDYHDLLAAA